MPRKIHVTLSDQLHHALDECATANEEPLGAFVRRALRQFLAAQGYLPDRTAPPAELRVVPPRSKADGSGGR